MAVSPRPMHCPMRASCALFSGGGGAAQKRNDSFGGGDITEVGAGGGGEGSKQVRVDNFLSFWVPSKKLPTYLPHTRPAVTTQRGKERGSKITHTHALPFPGLPCYYYCLPACLPACQNVRQLRTIFRCTFNINDSSSSPFFFLTLLFFTCTKTPSRAPIHNLSVGIFSSPFLSSPLLSLLSPLLHHHRHSSCFSSLLPTHSLSL